jgi:hypothetical protein
MLQTAYHHLLFEAFRDRDLEQFEKLLDETDTDPNHIEVSLGRRGKSLLADITHNRYGEVTIIYVKILLQHPKTIVDCRELISTSYMLPAITSSPSLLCLFRENKGFSLLKIKLWSDYETYVNQIAIIKLFDIRNRDNRPSTSVKYILQHIQLMLTILTGRSRQTSRLRLLSVDQWRYFSTFLF